MSTSYDRFVVAAFRGKSAAELAGAPPDALRGLSAADAAALAAGLGIDSIRDLAGHRFVRRAAAIEAAASAAPGYDPGPPPGWERRFAAAPLDAYQARPDLFRIDFGPVYYRGRLDGTARLLVVGQDPSANEILAHRVFVGFSGQRLQGFLTKLGLTRSYVMVNTFLYSVFGQFGSALRTLSRHDPILGYRNEVSSSLAAENPLQAVVSVGTAAHDAVERWPGAAHLPHVRLMHPAAPDEASLLASWNAALATLRPLVEPDDGAAADPDPYGAAFAPTDVTPIPRTDLPFGLPAFHGDGDHCRREGDTEIRWMSTPVE